MKTDAARRRCREFLEGGWGSIDWIEVYGQKSLINKNPELGEASELLVYFKPRFRRTVR